MKIDLPVTILFDCQKTDHRSIERAAAKLVCTLRFDTEDHAVSVELFQGYPTKDAANLGEPADAILCGLTATQLQKIKTKAHRWPSDYCTDEAAGLILQEEIDQEAAHNAQFGVGA